MPPANSPAALSPTDPTSPQFAIQPSERSLTPFSYFSSPVPDLASTLRTAAAGVAAEADVSFLQSTFNLLDHTAAIPRQISHNIDPQRDPRRADGQTTSSENAQGWVPRAPPQPATENPEDLSRRERLHRVLARLNRIHDPSSSSTSAYSNRTPSPHRQSLYDWAPTRPVEDSYQEENSVPQVLLQPGRQQSDTHSSILRVPSQTQLDSSRRRERSGNGTSTSNTVDSAWERRNRTRERDRDRERRLQENEWVTLRNRAIQRARQDGSATERILRYVMERERNGVSEEEDRLRGTEWPRRNNVSTHNSWRRTNPTSGDSITRNAFERAEYLEARRQQRGPYSTTLLPRLSTPPVQTSHGGTSTHSSPFLENAFKYVNDLRSCYRYEDSLSSAIDHGLATKEFFADKHDDFISNLDELKPLPASTWLQPGTVFDGHQHAMNSNHGLLHSSGLSSSSTASIDQTNSNYRHTSGTSAGFDHPPGSTRMNDFDAIRPWLSHQFSPPPAAFVSNPSDGAHDHWPVRVIIHAIDPEKMILQGTMEAYDVPQHANSISILTSAGRPKAGRKSEPITTYLEGHIIDLTTHSFITPSAAELKKRGPHSTSPANSTPYTTLPTDISFPSANAQIDASNWRKLPPFSSLATDDETARCVLSKARMDEIHNSYIFMRWKERCFVHSKDDKCSEPDRHGDQDRGHGLTISGFYYISLRRSDGVVEGLYFDPTSTLYQHLRLRGRADGWPAFEFR